MYDEDYRARRTHQDLFDIFFPINKIDLPEDLKTLANQIKQQIWEITETNPSFKKALASLYFLPMLHKTRLKSRASYYHELMRRPYGEDFTRMLNQMRYLYLSFIYDSKIGYVLSGYDATIKPLVHPSIEEHTLSFEKRLEGYATTDLFFNEKTQSLDLTSGELDYVVIGSGPAGSVIASELSAKGKKVLLLERGPFPVPGALNGTYVNDFYESKNMRFTASGSALVRAAQAVGGGTSVNIDLAFPPTFPSIAKRLQKWRDKGLIDPERFDEKNIEASNAWIEQKIGTINLSDSDINRNNRVLWDGSLAMGWKPSLYKLNRYRESPYQVSDKISAVEAFLLPAMLGNANPLYVQPDTEVEKLIFSEINGQRSVSAIQVKQLKYSGQGVIRDPLKLAIPENQVYTIRAKNFILSAGAFGSPAILLKSGANHFNPDIGKGLVIHPSVPIVAHFNESICNNEGLTASVFNDHFALKEGHGYILEAMEGSPSYGAVLLYQHGKEIYDSIRQYPKMAGFGVMLVDSTSPTNLIKLDETGKPVIQYELLEEDKMRLRRGLISAVQIAFAAGAKEVAIPSVETKTSILSGHKVFLHDMEEARAAIDNVKFQNNRTVITSAHMQSTLKMGPNKEHPVSLDHKLKGVTNLYVMDGSIFPESIGANPMQSIYTFAKVFVDNL